MYNSNLDKQRYSFAAHRQAPRLYVTPETNELVISLGRSYNQALGTLDLAVTNVTMLVKRRKRGAEKVLEWTAYAVDTSGQAHFEMHVEFMSEVKGFPRGMYDATIMIGDCKVGSLEIVKAPFFFVKDAKAVNERCHGSTNWVEPGCDEEVDSHDCGCDCGGKPSRPCSCDYSVKTHCYNCTNNITIKEIQMSDYSELF